MGPLSAAVAETLQWNLFERAKLLNGRSLRSFGRGKKCGGCSDRRFCAAIGKKGPPSVTLLDSSGKRSDFISNHHTPSLNRQVETVVRLRLFMKIELSLGDSHISIIVANATSHSFFSAVCFALPTRTGCDRCRWELEVKRCTSQMWQRAITTWTN